MYSGGNNNIYRKGAIPNYMIYVMTPNKLTKNIRRQQHGSRLIHNGITKIPPHRNKYK